MSFSVISKYLAWQHRVCDKVKAAVEQVIAKPVESVAVEAKDSQDQASAVAEQRPAVVREPRENRHQRKQNQAGAKPAVVEEKKQVAEVKPETTEKTVAEAVAQHEPAEEAQAPEEEVGAVKSMGEWTVPVFEREAEGDILFQDFTLDNRIMRALLDDMGFKKCSPIQGLALPQALAGNDIAGKAQTGTGKTATFLIAMLQKFLTQDEDDRKDNQPFALVLAPTRELAIQIGHDANELCAYCHFKTVPVYGGMDYDRQRRMLTSHVDMVVATPGRLIDYLKHGVVDLDKVKVLIIDEADRMLDMGFIPDVKRIIGRLKGPETRQTMLFSATLNGDIMRLASRWMRPNPVKLEVEPEHMLAEGIQETIYALTAAEKLPVLLWTLNHEDCHRVLIFRNRRDDVEELHRELLRFGVASEMLSGDVDQKKRLRILEDFRAGRIKVIVATDVAGRGIHVDDVTHVVNYDFPYEAEDYVHRVGRTARAGHTGRAISFADENSSFVIPDIEEYIGRSLPTTFPEDEMLQLPEEYKNVRPRVEKPHSMRPQSSHGSYRGVRVRRGGPRR